tara:strand:- start:134 stop:625 length:492 start_codon:yes stop_codon:yes gene_type:complete
MKNIVFAILGIFIFYGLVHDIFGNSDLIATIVTSLVLLVTYYRQKSLRENKANPTSTEFLIKDKERWEKMTFDSEKEENDSSNYSSAGHKQAKAEEELSEAQEVVENYLGNQKEDENIICMCSCDNCIEGICGECGKEECPSNEEAALYDEKDDEENYEEPLF